MAVTHTKTGTKRDHESRSSTKDNTIRSREGQVERLNKRLRTMAQDRTSQQQVVQGLNQQVWALQQQLAQANQREAQQQVQLLQEQQQRQAEQAQAQARISLRENLIAYWSTLALEAQEASRIKGTMLQKAICRLSELCGPRMSREAVYDAGRGYIQRARYPLTAQQRSILAPFFSHKTTTVDSLEARFGNKKYTDGNRTAVYPVGHWVEKIVGRMPQEEIQALKDVLP